MPDRCCVTNCKSNYKSTKGVYVSVFKFPKDERLKSEWMRKIPRQDFEPSQRSVVCEKHFHDDCIIRYDEILRNGEICRFQRKTPKLKPGSIPTIFPGCPSYCSEPEPVKRKSRDEKLKKNDDESLKQFLKKDEISSYENFATSLTIDNPIVKGYTVIRAESHTCILKLCLNSRPHIEKSLKIANDFSVEMYVGEITVKQNIYQHLLTKGKLMLWSQFENLMGILSRSSIDQVNHFELAVHHWKLHMENEESTDDLELRQFLYEQLLLSTKRKAYEEGIIRPQETEKTIIRPRFGLLRTAHRLEESSTVKFAFHLNAKTLYPTSIERQNVLPAVNVFHESNPAALERLAEHHPRFVYSVDDTATFLRLIKKWWDIMNVSHPNKGKFSRNPDSKPLTTSNSESLTFLSAFVGWVKKWRDMKQKARQGCLSKQTYFALIQTTSTIVNIANVLLKDGARYVLTAKFHTDALEFRFSQYRQLSGCNYHVSLEQVLESERKLRIKSVLHLHSKKYGNIPMKVFVNELCMREAEEVDVAPFMDIVEFMDLNVSTSDTEILTYIAGYCVHKLCLTCDTCKFFYQGAFDISVDLHEDILLSPLEKLAHTEYLDLIDRGGMKTPSSNVVFSLSGSPHGPGGNSRLLFHHQRVNHVTVNANAAYKISVEISFMTSNY
ncbi:hypothetical protein JTE90_024170 [Oedothorax gibbosus]|uniref:THAP-type domain-containing protein n=1 Tax=Oedothorax gibbosus TaxID=931172 RepID=A0AAV6UDC7_9ARAC|nr:hypothetical protein JTE90_024170 [Oedothorax gibbosus]